MVTKPDPKAQRTPFIRLLPIVVGVAALMLSVRLHDVWMGVSDGPVFLLGSDLEAQQPPRGAGPDTAAAAAAAKPGDASPAAAPAGASSTTTTAAATSPAATMPPAAGTTAEGGPPAVAPTPSLTASELEVLQKLTERRKQIDAREQEVIRREELLKAASDQIDRKVSELKTLQNTI